MKRTFLLFFLANIVGLAHAQVVSSPVDSAKKKPSTSVCCERETDGDCVCSAPAGKTCQEACPSNSPSGPANPAPTVASPR